MALSTETLYAALFSRLKARVTGAKRFTRRLIGWDQIPKEQQPAVMVVAEYARADAADGLPTTWRVGATAYVVTPPDVARKDADAAETTLTGVVDQIIAALEADANETGPRHYPDQTETTLGGVCHRAYVSGQIEIDAGLHGEQGVARVPIEMLKVV